ncbi:PIN domain-containing protein [Halobellus sp. Atlit-31R]|nr:PIN domain-containing protein [Halobellus sp. Atlit-31R]
MTAFVETDFLLAIAKDDDWMQERAEDVLAEQDVVTSPFAYLEILLVFDRGQYDYVRLFANFLDLVPVESDDERQIVLKAVSYYQDGMTPFSAFHAVTAETRALPILSSDKAYQEVDPELIPLEPDSGE